MFLLSQAATYSFGLSLLAANGQSIVSLVPLSEGRAVNLDNAVLHKGLGSHKLIVTGIVHNINDTGLACDT